MGIKSIGTTTQFPGRSDLGDVSVLIDGVEQPLYRLPGGELFVVSRPRRAYQMKMVATSGGELEFVIFDSEVDNTGGYAERPTGRLGNVLSRGGTHVLDKTGDVDDSLPLKFKRGTGFIQCVLYFEYRSGYSMDPFPMIETGSFQRGARLGELTIYYGSRFELQLRLMRLKATLPVARRDANETL